MGLTWDDTGDRLYETGVKNAVLYIYDKTTSSYGGTNGGVAWNGVTSVTESPEGAEETELYADDIKYLSLYSAEEFGFTIEAYTYPDEFMACDGSIEVNGAILGQQSRAMFGLAFKTTLGNDVDGNDHGYKLHLIYGARAGVSERQYQTINDSPEAITFSWECTTTPLAVGTIDGVAYKPLNLITIDSTKADATKLKALEDTLFGNGSGGKATLPLPSAVLAALKAD